MISRNRSAWIEGIEVVIIFFVKLFVLFLKCYWNVFAFVLVHRFRYASKILLQTKKILKALPSLVDITVPHGKHVTVCGDVHGQVLVYDNCSFGLLFAKTIVANNFKVVLCYVDIWRIGLFSLHCWFFLYIFTFIDSIFFKFEFKFYLHLDHNPT